MSQNFKRLHLFNGMLATEDDWNAGEEYHYRKNCLQNRAFQGRGVVAHYLEGLTVRAIQPSGMRLVVNPGLAIDPQGRECLVHDPVLMSVNLEQLGGGKPFTGNVFVCLSFEENPDHFVVSEIDARITGHRRIEERARIRLSGEGVGREEIELARVYVTPETLRISDAVDPTAPQGNELDLRYVAQIGPTGGQVSAIARLLIVNALEKRNRLLGLWLLDYNVMEANLPRAGLLTGRTLVRTGLLDRRGVMDLLAGIHQLEEDMLTLFLRRTGDWERVWVSREFKSFREAWKRANAVITPLRLGPTPAMDALQFERECERGLELYRETNATLERLTEQLGNLLERGAVSGPTYVEVTDEELRIMSAEPPHRLALDGKPYIRVDLLEVTIPASIEGHQLKLDVGPNDVVQGTTPATYPDGTRIVDGGLSYRRGSVFFFVTHVKPGRDLLMIRRVEFRELRSEEEVRIDDQPIGVWKITGDDREHLWRNALYHIDGEFLVGPRPRIRLRLMEGSSPANMYRFWFYQAV